MEDVIKLKYLQLLFIILIGVAVTQCNNAFSWFGEGILQARQKLKKS